MRFVLDDLIGFFLSLIGSSIGLEPPSIASIFIGIVRAQMREERVSEFTHICSPYRAENEELIGFVAERYVERGESLRSNNLSSTSDDPSAEMGSLSRRPVRPRSQYNLFALRLDAILQRRKRDLPSIPLRVQSHCAYANFTRYGEVADCATSFTCEKERTF